MFRSYRSILIALAGLVLCAQHPKPDARPKETKAQESIAKSLENVAATYHQEAERGKTSKEAEPCRPGDDRRYSDLCAQWKAADAAENAAWWARVSGVLSVAGLLGVAGALCLTIQSNKIARNTARRQLRAYLSFKEFRLNRDKMDNKLILAWSNGGQTPANHVDAYADWIVVDDPLPDNFPFPRPEIPIDDGSATVGIGGEILAVCTNGLPVDIERLVGEGKKHFYAWGQATYTDVFERRWHTNIAAKMNVELLKRNGGKIGAAVRWTALPNHNDAT